MESLPPRDNSNNKNNKDKNNKDKNNKDKNNKKPPSSSPRESKNPKILCNPKVVRENIKTKEELESAEVNYKCQDNRDIGFLETYIEEEPFYYKTWEKIFE